VNLDDIPEDLVITITDVRRQHCVAGARAWWAAHGLDFRHFLKHGIPARELAATGDALAFAVITEVILRRGGDSNG
jgi:hypothetical protein